jgi:hypothetical protein
MGTLVVSNSVALAMHMASFRAVRNFTCTAEDDNQLKPAEGEF